MDHVEQFESSQGTSAGPHELICRIVRQDKKAWAQLFERLQEPLTKFLTGKFPKFCPQQIDDILQDTLIAVWNKAASYHGLSDQEARGWVRRIAVNQGIDHIRRGKRFEALPERSKRDEFKVPDRRPSEDSCAEEWKQLLDTLSPQQSRVVKGVMDGKTGGEIARELGISASRVSEIKKEIREKGWLIFHPEDE